MYLSGRENLGRYLQCVEIAPMIIGRKRSGIDSNIVDKKLTGHQSWYGINLPFDGLAWPSSTSRNAGSDGCIQFYIGCGHPIQNWVPRHQVNQEPIQTWWPNTRSTEFELVNDSLGRPVPDFELDGRIQYKLGCNHPSQLFWK
jgi:hypothetical protein